MSRKYLTRAFVWALLIVILSVATFYIRVLFISPLNTQIDNLNKQKTETEQAIRLFEAQLVNFNNIQFNNNEITEMVPSVYDVSEIEQEFILRPVYMFGLELGDYNISDAAPTNLEISNDMISKKVSVSFNISRTYNNPTDPTTPIDPNDTGTLKIDPLYDYIQELYDSKRSVYFGNFSYKQQGEVRPDTSLMDSIEVTLEFYLFYYKE